MLRRAQLALALVLVLVLAPLASATCGIACLAGTPHHPTQSARSQHDCFRASACCHSNGPAVCAATQALEAIAALLSTNTAAAQHDAAPAIVAADLLPLSQRDLAAHGIDSSPPGQLRASNPIPLRV
jgi:hypothetical protein